MVRALGVATKHRLEAKIIQRGITEVKEDVVSASDEE